MAKRKIITINKDRCNGCGECIPNCPEGAIQIIDSKAYLVSDLFCDGLGACLGHCPQAAITIEEREAKAYDEAKVMDNIIQGGENVIKAHLAHLKEHNEKEYLSLAIDILIKKGIKLPHLGKPDTAHATCPGVKAMSIAESKDVEDVEQGKRLSQLSHWPIQLHLVSPQASYFKGADLLISADCVAYTLADFHKDYLKGKSLVIACPKLDSGLDVYKEKTHSLISEAEIRSLTIMTMEVPCCTGLLSLCKEALLLANRKIPLRHIVVSINGKIIKDEKI
ncbi:MAG: 4Fe-4S binding protein [Candidatus Orphnella occulta]|nr:4Fe-4S binding protein [Candidatus Orphnella occulta]